MDEVRNVLKLAGLDSLWQNFQKEKIDSINLCKGLNDKELNNLGLVTIGDKVRFRSVVQSALSDSEVTEQARFQPSPRTGINGAFRERNALFMPSRSRESTGTRLSSKKKKGRTWTASFLCLSDKNTFKVPNSAEKECLFKAGLGLKKITFSANDGETEVHATITREFPKLEDSGGFEIMCCTSTCRSLKSITCKWDVKSLKSVVGPQARFYIRPIQRCLPVEDAENVENESNLTITCENCGKKFNISQIREHITVCSDESDMLTEDRLSTSAPQSVQENTDLVRENRVSTSAPQSEQENTDLVRENRVSTSAPQSVQENTGLVRENRLSTSSPQFIQENSVLVRENRPSSSAPQFVQENSRQDDDDFPYFVESVFNYVLESEQQADTQISTLTKDCIDDIATLNIQDPIHILRYLQSKIVTGRKLDIDSDDIENGNAISGETNFIVIDRQSVVETAIENISSIENLRLTLEVQFSDEVAEDYGGPRKEFFSLVLGKMYEKYFDPVKDFLAEDYETVGKIFALSMLQNGKLPRIFDEALIDQLMAPSPSKPMLYLKKGMNALGLIQIIQTYPILLHLLTPEHRPPLSLKMLTQLLQPQFSAVGSNKRIIESIVYQKFIKYTREVVGRRINVTTGKMLSFVTGIDEEPPLGFSLPPTLTFTERLSYLPTSNTCINKITLTVPQEQMDLPEDEHLFTMFDYAFCNSYFGLA